MNKVKFYVHIQKDLIHILKDVCNSVWVQIKSTIEMLYMYLNKIFCNHSVTLDFSTNQDL